MRWFRVRAVAPESGSEDAAAALADLGSSGVRIEDGDPARLEAHYEADVSASAAAALAPWGGRVESAEWVEEEDWATAWRRRVPSLVVGPFCIHPTHEPPRPGAVNLRIDPGMAFGTGEHPTTRLMLLEIAAMAADRPLGRFLDLGCGTGVLAMAAASLGAAPVLAADTDVRAVEIARGLAADNGFGGRIEFADGSLSRCTGTFDTIVANLTTDVHLTLAGAYGPKLARDGRLRLGGVRDAEAAEVERATGTAPRRAERGWVVLGR